MRRGTSELLVLCYHAVSDDWPASLAISGAELERQLQRFVGEGFRGTTFSRAIAEKGEPGRRLAVTFDDAYHSVIERAFPILERLGLPGTVFAPTTGDALRVWPGVDRWLGTPWEAELAAASWDELRRLQAAGWEVGSHTRSHPHLTQLDDASLFAELDGSRRDCERLLGVRCQAIAYPFGDADARVAAAARRAGYAAGAALDEPPAIPPRTNDVMRWPRLGVYREDGPTRLRIKARMFRRNPRAWSLAQRLSGAGPRGAAKAQESPTPTPVAGSEASAGGDDERK